MTKVEWFLLVAVVAILIGPFATLKAVASFRRRRTRDAEKSAERMRNTYDDENDS